MFNVQSPLSDRIAISQLSSKTLVAGSNQATIARTAADYYDAELYTKNIKHVDSRKNTLVKHQLYANTRGDGAALAARGQRGGRKMPFCDVR